MILNYPDFCCILVCKVFLDSPKFKTVFLQISYRLWPSIITPFQVTSASLQPSTSKLFSSPEYSSDESGGISSLNSCSTIKSMLMLLSLILGTSRLAGAFVVSSHKKHPRCAHRCQFSIPNRKVEPEGSLCGRKKAWKRAEKSNLDNHLMRVVRVRCCPLRKHLLNCCCKKSFSVFRRLRIRRRVE